MNEIVSIRDRLNAMLPKLQRALPWASLSWGLYSGYSMARDYSRVSKLANFTLGAVFFLFFVHLCTVWFLRARHQQGTLGRFGKLVTEKEAFIVWAGSTGTQFYVQYILFFTLPFLYYTKSWLSFAGSLLIVCTVIWDPWWNILFSKKWYRVLIRAWSCLLALSFLFPILYLPFLEKFDLLVTSAFLALLLPWTSLWKFWHEKKYLDFVPLLCALMGFAGVHLFARDFKFTPLSIWVKNSALGLGILERQVAVPFAGNVTLQELEEGIDEGLCCATPVVAPGTLKGEVVHEWHLDGQKIDSISLGEVRGLSEKVAFRTYSCKQNFPQLKHSSRIMCKIYLKSGRLLLGKVEVRIADK